MESKITDLDPDNLESRSKVKSKPGCNIVFCDTDDSFSITEMYPETNFLLAQSGNTIDLVYGSRCTHFVPIFLTYMALGV